MDVVEGRRRGPAPLVVTGPLAAYESLVRTELASRGYAVSSVGDAVLMMRRLSLWMDRRGLVAGELTPTRVEEFLAFRRAVCSSGQVARRSLGAVIKVLRHAGTVPVPAGAGGDAVQEVLADYGAYLRGERGLAAESVRCYCVQARKFLAALSAPLDDALARLGAGQVTAFMVRHSADAGSVWSAKALVPCPCRKLIHAGHAACRYSWRMPPRRSRLRMSRPAIWSGSVVDAGSGCRGRVFAMPWWGR